MIVDTDKLVGPEELLQRMFAPQCRPSKRWLSRMQKQRKVPFLKLGCRVFFDPADVRAVWQKKGIIRES